MEKTIGIMMADLSGFTAMTEIHGPRMAAAIIKQYTQMVKEALRGESFMLERVGDQVVVLSSSADDLADTAMALLQSTSKEANFLPIHAGLHYGKTLELDGRYYGSPINLTARLAAKARRGKVLFSEEFKNALTDPSSYRFMDHGMMRFKNILESTAVYELLPPATDPLMVTRECPVCQMQLHKTDTSIYTWYQGELVYFCSEECKYVFQQYPMYEMRAAV